MKKFPVVLASLVVVAASLAVGARPAAADPKPKPPAVRWTGIDDTAPVQASFNGNRLSLSFTGYLLYDRKTGAASPIPGTTISGDGKFVFTTQFDENTYASNVVRYSVADGTTTPVTAGVAALQLDGFQGWDWEIAASDYHGRVLALNGSNGDLAKVALALYDTKTGKVTVVVDNMCCIGHVSLSRDASTVAFIGPFTTTDTYPIGLVVLDVKKGKRTNVQASYDNGDSNQIWDFDLSGDGKHIAYVSQHGFSEDPRYHLFDLKANTTQSWGPAAFAFSGYHVSINDDGSRVAYNTLSPTAFDPEDVFDTPQIFVRDSKTGQSVEVSAGLGGSAPNGEALSFDMSGDGGTVYFASTATNLVTATMSPDSSLHLYETRLDLPLKEPQD